MDWLATLKEFGFPAALCGFLIFNELKTKRRMEKRIAKLEDDRVKFMAETIDKNTAALHLLTVELCSRPCIRGTAA